MWRDHLVREREAERRRRAISNSRGVLRNGRSCRLRDFLRRNDMNDNDPKFAEDLLRGADAIAIF
jgi:hypothetical protein